MNPVNVTVTGAAGQIGYALLFRIAAGEMLGRDTPDVTRFAETLERVCVETVESGKMTKDLAQLVGEDQPFQTTQEFLTSIDENLQKEMTT